MLRLICAQGDRSMAQQPGHQGALSESGSFPDVHIGNLPPNRLVVSSPIPSNPQGPPQLLQPVRPRRRAQPALPKLVRQKQCFLARLDGATIIKDVTAVGILVV